MESRHRQKPAASGDDEETGQPGPQMKNSPTSAIISEYSDGVELRPYDPEQIRKETTYRTLSLTSWEAFKPSWKKVVWRDERLWMMMVKLVLLELVVIFITVLVVPDPRNLRVAKFTEVSKFLNVIVGLLLSFFLSSTMASWYNCVSGFWELLDAIRNLNMQFVGLGAYDEEATTCLRYGLLSCWMLQAKLRAESKLRSDPKLSRKILEVMWHELSQTECAANLPGEQMLLLPDEEQVLRQTQDPPSLVWVWVASLIGKMAEEGTIPAMQTPTYGRIMNLCQAAHGGIRQVRSSILVQMPLVYTHLLATLVHCNNILNAITLGIVLGLSLGTWFQHHIPQWYDARRASEGEAQRDLQTAIVTFMYCFFGPLLYQALLVISMHLAQPFDGDQARIPLLELCLDLETDLRDGRDLLKSFPFDLPYFKKPAGK